MDSVCPDCKLNSTEREWREKLARDQTIKSKGPYRSDGTYCYYKDSLHRGRVEAFRLSGTKEHQGERCMTCGSWVTEGKGHNHPRECPY